MSLKDQFMRKLRNRIWRNSRMIIRLRRRALDSGKPARYELHNEIDELKMEREKDVIKLEELCDENNGVLEEVKVGVETVVDEVKHSLGGVSPEDD